VVEREGHGERKLFFFSLEWGERERLSPLCGYAGFNGINGDRECLSTPEACFYIFQSGTEEKISLLFTVI
jgi:hypothetical protein